MLEAVRKTVAKPSKQAGLFNDRVCRMDFCDVAGFRVIRVINVFQNDLAAFLDVLSEDERRLLRLQEQMVGFKLLIIASWALCR